MVGLAWVGLAGWGVAVHISVMKNGMRGSGVDGGWVIEVAGAKQSDFRSRYSTLLRYLTLPSQDTLGTELPFREKIK